MSCVNYLVSVSFVQFGSTDLFKSYRRSERNQLRSAVWAVAAVPWVPELTIDHLEWDVMWRVTFGDMSADMRNRLDHPAYGFVWRGRCMEYAVSDAVRECAPPAMVAVTSQPSAGAHPTRPRGARPYLAGWVEAGRHCSCVHHRDNHHAGRAHHEHAVRVGRRLAGCAPASARECNDCEVRTRTTTARSSRS